MGELGNNILILLLLLLEQTFRHNKATSTSVITCQANKNSKQSLLRNIEP